MRELAKEWVSLQAVCDGECHPLENDTIRSQLWASATFLLQSPRRSLQVTLLPNNCAPSISSPCASVKLQALLTSRPSLVRRDWLDYRRRTGKSCLRFWTKTGAATSRRRSSSKESRHWVYERSKVSAAVCDCEWLTKCTLHASDVSCRISPLARGNWPWPRPRLWWLQEIRTVMEGSGWKVGASEETASHLWPDDERSPPGSGAVHWAVLKLQLGVANLNFQANIENICIHVHTMTCCGVYKLSCYTWLNLLLLFLLHRILWHPQIVSPSPCWTFYWKSRCKDKRPQ